MRFLATLAGRKKTERFVAYLVAQNISTHFEASSGNADTWDVWIRDEDRVNLARNHLADYEVNPEDKRYTDAVGQAETVLQEREAKKAKAAKNFKTSKEVFQRDLIGGKIPPITLALVVISVFVSIVTNFGRVTDINSYGFKLLEQLWFVSKVDFAASGFDPAASLKKFEIWRALTPIFIHLDPMHILFNGFMMVSLGRLIEKLEGPAIFAILVFTIAVSSNLLQGLLPESMMGNPMFGGLSGVTYGLFGYIWVKTTLNPHLGIQLAPGVVIIMMAWLLLTMSGAFKINTANLAHLGGLICGAFLAFLMTQLRAGRYQ